MLFVDIVVSSISSDEESSNQPIRAPTIESLKHQPGGELNSGYPTSGETSSAYSTTSPSPRILPHPDYFFSMGVSPTSTGHFDYCSTTTNTAKSPVPTNERYNEHPPLQAMDTLRPSGLHLPPSFQKSNFLSPSDAINSPPRSNSVDLSMLRRDIELWSVSSGDQSEVGSDGELELTTPSDSIKTLRSVCKRFKR